MGHIVLVGLMGSGKTTIGRRLARRLDRPFLDTDEMVVEDTGRSVRDIFESEGEETFRVHESRALARALDRPESSVIAGAGGVVLAASNRDLLKRGHRVIWLRPPIDTLAARVDRRERTPTGHRPLLDLDPVGALADMERTRAPFYAEVATEIVDVQSQSIDDLVEMLAAGEEVAS